MELNFQGLEMHKWHITKDRAQAVEGKNWFICLVIMFTPRVMVIKMSKMAHFFYFLLMPAKNQSQRSYLALSENTMDSWILRYH